jgi:hypothetical protein
MADEENKTPDFSSGVMLCLRPTNAESLVIPGGMEVSDLHCTLFYFGKTDEFDFEAADQLKSIVGGIAPEARVLEGEVTAIAEFGTQGEQPALVLLVDAPGLGEFRADLLKRIRAVLDDDEQPYDNHDFTAHITVVWSPEEDDVAAAQALVGHPLRFEVLDLEWGTESTKWNLGEESGISVRAVEAGLLLGEELTASASEETTDMAEATETEAAAEFAEAEDRKKNPFRRDPVVNDDADDRKPGDPDFEPEPDDTKVPEDESETTPATEGEGEDDKDLKKKKSELATDGAATFTAIPPHTTPVTDSRDFDGDTAKTRTRSGEAPAYYNDIYAWHDAANSPGNKTGYKFPHHMVSEAGEPGAAVTWAVKAALMLIDDSVIPKGDQKGVYNHLAGHLRDAGVDVPELGSDDASTDDVMAAVALVREQFTTEEAAMAAEETTVETPASEALAEVVAAAPAPAPEPPAALDITGLNDAALLSEFMRRYLESVATKAPATTQAASTNATTEFAEVGEAQPEVAAAAGYQWAAVLIPEGVPSGDGRMIENLALTWRELPLPLMLQTINAEGHSGSVICGSIKEIQRINNNIVGLGDFDPGADGQRALDLLTAGTMRGVSADIDSVMMELRDENNRPVTRKQLAAAGEEGIRATEVLVSGRIMGATICPFPAFQEASITVLSPEAAASDEVIVASGSDVQGEVWRVNSSVPFVVVGVHDMFDLTETIVASGGVTELPVIPVNPPAEWFALDHNDPIPFTVYPNGRCYGLIAQFGTCHIGNRGKCVEVPRSTNNYGYFRNKNTLSAEGNMIATGPVIMDTVHPSLKLRASDAQAFYAHNGCAVADVALYETEHGIVAAGAVRPDATPEEVRRFRGSSISGDWRKINGKLELVGLLSVNVPGFPIEALVASGADEVVETMEARGLYNSVSDDMESLVAAGAITDECTSCGSGSVDGDAIVAFAEQLADIKATLSELSRIVRPIRLEQAAARIAEMSAKTAAATEPTEVEEA